jgi:hypothetical protein
MEIQGDMTFYVWEKLYGTILQAIFVHNLQEALVGHNT